MATDTRIKDEYIRLIFVNFLNAVIFQRHFVANKKEASQKLPAELAGRRPSAMAFLMKFSTKVEGLRPIGTVCPVKIRRTILVRKSEN